MRRGEAQGFVVRLMRRSCRLAAELEAPKGLLGDAPEGFASSGE